MRLALLKGYSLSMLMPNIAPLVIFSVIMLPISIMAFGYAIKRAKIEGTLTHY
jgi:ABC-2 type transport system permease protein